VPAFLQTKGLVKQHLESFNYFIETDIKKILQANARIDSDVDPNFFLKFLDINVKRPQAQDVQKGVTYQLTPQECRLRDLTYGGTIVVDIEYLRGKERIVKRGIEIGRMPIMLKSSKCMLQNRSAKQIVDMGECPLDPGGYFIIRGTEKVILIQEQLSKNRIIVETDRLGCIGANVTSSTHEKKSKTAVVLGKQNKVHLKHNSFSSDIPIVVFFKAMGIETDQEIMEMVCGQDIEFMDLLLPSIVEAAELEVFTQIQAIEWIGAKVKMNASVPFKWGAKRNLPEEAKELLTTTVLAHIPVETFLGRPNYRPKAVYAALMVRRTLQATRDGGIVDDRDFVGNKRLEL
jgi:DNA-directed RNA polymerase III subunit RPC2